MLRKIIFVLLALTLFVACAQESTDDNETFVVGMECAYAPFNWLQNEADEDAIFIEDSNGYCKGYDVTVAQHIANELGRELEVKILAWEGLIPALNSGSIDAIIAGMSYTSERAKQVSFTNAYYYSDYVMIVPVDSNYVDATSLDDFNGAKIVGQMGTNYDIIIDQIEGVQHLPALNNYPLIVNALLSETADGAPAEKPTADSIVASNPELTYITFEEGQGFTQSEDITTEVSIALRKEDTELLTEINTILDAITLEQRDAWMQVAIESPQD